MCSYYKYPFLKGLDEYFREKYGSGIDLERLFSVGRLRTKVMERVRSAVSDGGQAVRVEHGEDEYLSFYMGLLVAGLADRWALMKYVDSEAKTFVTLLEKENSKFVWDVSRRLGVAGELLAKDDECGHRVVLEVKPRPEFSCFQFRMTIPRYLRCAERLLEEAGWSLTSAYVERGYVYLPKKKYARLLEDPLKEYLLKVFESLSLRVADASVVEDMRKEIRDLVRSKRGYTSDEAPEEDQTVLGDVREEFFPPCIEDLIKLLRANEHLTHSQRFALATFLLNIGASVNYVIDLMRNAPDFNERVARYQIEHLAGLKGGGKKYSMYKCANMKELGMCVAECGVKSPIQYYLRRVRSVKRGGGSRSSRNQGS